MATNDQGNFGDADNDGIPGETVEDALVAINTMSIVIDPVNDAPVAHPDLAIAIEAGGLNNADPGVDPTGNVLDNDTDVDIATNGDVLKVTRVENSIGGFATVAASGVTPLAGRYGTLYITATGGFQYVVDNTNAAVQALRSAGDVLRDSFGYFITDSGGLGSSTSLTIDIHGANDTPIAHNDAGTAVESGGTNNGSPGADAIGNVLLNDTDVDSTVYGETKAVSLVRYDGIGGGRIFPVAPGAPRRCRSSMAA